MRGRSSITLLALAGLAVTWSLLATGVHAAGAAAILPVLLLLAPLLAQRYPGEARITRLRERRRPTLRRVRVNAPAPRPVRRVAVRGRLLLARGMAVRPPPARPAHA